MDADGYCEGIANALWGGIPDIMVLTSCMRGSIEVMDGARQRLMRIGGAKWPAKLLWSNSHYVVLRNHPGTKRRASTYLRRLRRRVEAMEKAAGLLSAESMHPSGCKGKTSGMETSAHYDQTSDIMGMDNIVKRSSPRVQGDEQDCGNWSRASMHGTCASEPLECDMETEETYEQKAHGTGQRDMGMCDQKGLETEDGYNQIIQSPYKEMDHGTQRVENGMIYGQRSFDKAGRGGMQNAAGNEEEETKKQHAGQTENPD